MNQTMEKRLKNLCFQTLWAVEFLFCQIKLIKLRLERTNKIEKPSNMAFFSFPLFLSEFNLFHYFELMHIKIHSRRTTKLQFYSRQKNMKFFIFTNLAK